MHVGLDTVGSRNDIVPLSCLDCRRGVQNVIVLELELKLELEPELELELGQLGLEDW